MEVVVLLVHCMLLALPTECPPTCWPVCVAVPAECRPTCRPVCIGVPAESRPTCRVVCVLGSTVLALLVGVGCVGCAADA